jgi:predicted  nucleic acid-binding Zn-ribbon protein
MTTITKEQMNTLVELQKIEIEKLKVQRVLDAVAKKLTHLEAGLIQMTAEISGQREQLAELKQRYREFEDQVREKEDLIRKMEEKRRAVKTNREYQSLLKEEEQLKTRRSQIEDEMLVLMSGIETTEKDLVERETEFAEKSRAIEADKLSVKENALDSEERFATLKSQWDEVARQTSPDLLKKFNQVKSRQNNGVAVAPVRHAVCYGCHMNIPPQMFNELQRCDSLKLCPFCYRILYWDKD